MPQQANYKSENGVQFQTGEIITLFMVFFMVILVTSVVSYYKFIAPSENAWKLTKKKKRE